MKLLKEVKQKLKLLNPAKFNQMMNEHGGLSAAQMLGVGGGMDSDHDGDNLADIASPEAMAMRKGGKAVKKAKKKPSVGAGQRKVFNNYMEK